jgi:hypothetical protein
MTAAVSVPVSIDLEAGYGGSSSIRRRSRTATAGQPFAVDQGVDLASLNLLAEALSPPQPYPTGHFPRQRIQARTDTPDAAAGSVTQILKAGAIGINIGKRQLVSPEQHAAKIKAVRNTAYLVEDETGAWRSSNGATA